MEEGRKIAVDAIPRLSFVPQAVQLAVRGWLELQERGFGDGRVPFHIDMSAFIAHVRNGHSVELAGILVFTRDDTIGRLWVDLAYVIPECRGHGVFRSMWEDLSSYALKSAALTIEMATSVQNGPMRAVAKKLRCEEKAVQMVYQVVEP